MGKKRKAARKKPTKRASSRSSNDQLKRTCAVMEYHNHLAQTDETYRRNRRTIEMDFAHARFAGVRMRTTVVRIPVVVHVLYHSDEENLSQEQIESQIDALNRDFRQHNTDVADVPAPFQDFVADTLIEFALAVRDPLGNATSGITRTYTSKTHFPYSSFDPAATAKLDNLIKRDEFGKSPWPRDDYLNIWVCNIHGGLLGYAAFPGGPAATDGVVINHPAFGSTGTASPPFNLGRTAVHEVGHWLNLLHIWGDDGMACTGSDNVSDTPNQAGPNSGPGITKDSFPHVTCGNAPHGDMFMNYMDYVDDKVMIMFTQGQVDRMNATLDGPRSSLKDSQGLVPVTTERLALGEERFSLANAVGGDAEAGTPTQTVFDGVSWVPAP
jgi:hypothetical protein